MADVSRNFVEPELVKNVGHLCRPPCGIGTNTAGAVYTVLGDLVIVHIGRQVNTCGNWIGQKIAHTCGLVLIQQLQACLAAAPLLGFDWVDIQKLWIDIAADSCSDVQGQAKPGQG